MLGRLVAFVQCIEYNDGNPHMGILEVCGSWDVNKILKLCLDVDSPRIALTHFQDIDKDFLEDGVRASEIEGDSAP